MVAKSDRQLLENEDLQYVPRCLDGIVEWL